MPVIVTTPFIQASQYPQAVLDDTPVFYYRLEGGLLGIDSSGNGNNANSVVDISPATGKVGGAGDYAVSTSLMRVPPDATINNMAANTLSYTLEAWVFITNYSVNKQLFAKTDPATTGGYQCWIDTAGKINIRRFYPSASDIEASTAAVPLNQWAHVVAAMRGDRTGAFYINGVSSAPVTLQTGSGVGVSDAAEDLSIGNRLFGGSQPFQGLMDEAAGYSYELSAGRVLAHYNAGV